MRPAPERSDGDSLRWKLLEKKKLEVFAVRAFGLFREKGIEPVLIKGIAAGLYYPPDDPRISIDLDLAVSDADYSAADAIARSREAEGLAIDLHRELRHLDTVAWDDLFANSRELPFEDGSIRILRPEDHLRVLCVHWLTDGGSNKDRLRDIYYAVANRDDDFDWGRFLNVVSPKRRRWLICTLGLAEKYLGLDLSGTPAAGAAETLPAWLVSTVEREWAAEVKFEPMEVVVHSRRNFLSQLGRRLRPNPIWATVQSEGSFDAPTRIHYQTLNFVRRIVPSIKRIAGTFRS